MYCEIFVGVIFGVIQLIPKTPMMGFVIGSHHGASLCPLIVHHVCNGDGDGGAATAEAAVSVAAAGSAAAAVLARRQRWH